MVHQSHWWGNMPPHQQPANLPEHWKDADIRAEVCTHGLPPQLIINGDPMPHAYRPPDCKKWKFKAGAGGNSIWEHLPRLAEFASRAGVIVEIGIASMTGSTHAFDLGLQASDAAPGRKFHIGVDLHESVAGPWVPQSPFWQFISGSSKDPATVEKVKHALSMDNGSGEVVPLSIDILYIDTVHEYEFLKEELANWLPVIGPNTLVLFHDTHRGGRYDRMTDAIMEMVEAPVYEYDADDKYVGETTGGHLYYTHQYLQYSTTCEGLGGLAPKAGWPK
jgi:hypothetical protein